MPMLWSHSAKTLIVSDTSNILKIILGILSAHVLRIYTEVARCRLFQAVEQIQALGRARAQPVAVYLLSVRQLVAWTLCTVLGC